jgi:hypothetical protein
MVRFSAIRDFVGRFACLVCLRPMSRTPWLTVLWFARFDLVAYLVSAPLQPTPL